MVVLETKTRRLVRLHGEVDTKKHIAQHMRGHASLRKGYLALGHDIAKLRRQASIEDEHLSAKVSIAVEYIHTV